LCFEVVTLERWEDLVGEKETAEIGFSHVIDYGSVDFSMMSAGMVRDLLESFNLSFTDDALSDPVWLTEAVWSAGLKDVDSSENASEDDAENLVKELGLSDARMSDEDRESFRKALMSILEA